MIVNKERSKLYSIYYFTTGDPTNFAQKQVEAHKTMTVTGSGGRNTQVTDKQIVTEVTNWYNCSRHSISEDDSDNTLFLTAGGRSNYGVNYTRIKKIGYMKDCLLIEEGKNMSTLSGVAWYDAYSFYFSFRTLKPNEEIFYFNHEGVLGVYSKRKKTESSGTDDASVSGYVNQLFVSVLDHTILVVKSVVDEWLIVSVIVKDEVANVYLDGTKVGSLDLNEAKRPLIAKPGIMISGAAHVSNIILFKDAHDYELVIDMNYWLKNI